MAKLFCLKHPQYDGLTSPRLSCAGCCSIYVENIKGEQPMLNATQEAAASQQAAPPKQAMSVRQWLDHKDKLGVSHNSEK